MGLQGLNQSVMVVIFSISCGPQKFSWNSLMLSKKYTLRTQPLGQTSFKVLVIKLLLRALKAQAMVQKRQQSSLNYLFAQPYKLVMSSQRLRLAEHLRYGALPQVKRLQTELSIFLKAHCLNRWQRPLQVLMGLFWLMDLNTVDILTYKQNTLRYFISLGQHCSQKRIQIYYPLRRYHLMMRPLPLLVPCPIPLHQKVFLRGLPLLARMNIMQLVGKLLLNVLK